MGIKVGKAEIEVWNGWRVWLKNRRRPHWLKHEWLHGRSINVYLELFGITIVEVDISLGNFWLTLFQFTFAFTWWDYLPTVPEEEEETITTSDAETLFLDFTFESSASHK